MELPVEVWIVDDNRADRMILAVLLEEMHSFSEIREFPSGSSMINHLDKLEDGLFGRSLLVFCDANMGAESGEIVLSQVAMKMKPNQRYHVLMSGMKWEDEDWRPAPTIDDFMEKQSNLDTSRMELSRIVNSAINKLLPD